MSLAIALDRKHVAFKEQAFQLLSHEDGTQALQFLMPKKVEEVLLNDPWNLKINTKDTRPSGQRLNAYMTKACFLEEQKVNAECLSFTMHYDQKHQLTELNFDTVTTPIHAVHFFDANNLLKPEIQTPLGLEMKKLRIFAQEIMVSAGRTARPNSNAEWVNQCLSTEVNKGFDAYLRKHALTGFAKTHADGPLTCDPTKFHRASAYGREVDQYYNLLQCLLFARNREVLDLEASHNVVHMVNRYDKNAARLHVKAAP